MDKFVSEYLKNQGFEKALAEFRAQQEEMKQRRGGEDTAPVTNTSPFGEVAEIVRHVYSSGESKSISIEHYTQFRSWVRGSLDIVKLELDALLFPLFVRR